MKNSQQNASEIINILLTSVAGYLVLLFAAYKLSEISYFWVVALAIPTHFFHSRMFVVMHDCGHYSFFKSRFLNNLLGHVTAFFFYTPFFMWRELHNKHHAYQGNLDKRDKSLDVWTLTTEEFARAGAVKKWAYRIYRHPLFLFSIAPYFLFLLIFRVPFERFSTKAIANILILDALLLGFLVFQPQLLLKLFLVQGPSLFIGFSMASFLFYIQHQFEGTLWLRDIEFNNSEIALHGSSFYRLPPFLNWVYGNIGYHHIHHLDVKIPMYNLSRAQEKLQHEHSSVFLRDTFKTFKLKLWDEKNRKMVGF